MKVSELKSIVKNRNVVFYKEVDAVKEVSDETEVKAIRFVDDELCLVQVKEDR